MAEHVAFTVGTREVYDFLEPGTMKVGRREPGDPEYPGGYSGGVAFRDAKSADSWLAANGLLGFGVYRLGLPAPFDECVGPGMFEGRPYDALRMDCPILGPA